MTISLVFSFWLYNVSLSEIRQSVSRVPGPIHRYLLDDNPNFANELRASQEQAVTEARRNLIYQLGIINTLIAISATTLSYYLARRTLLPIELAHDAQSRFTADASHELRTPIAAMRLENEILLSDSELSVKSAKAQFKSNIEELDKLTRLTEGLLAQARLEDDSFEKSETSINSIIEESLNQVRTKAEEKKQVLRYKPIKDAKITVNKIAVIQALVVLLDNAVKYSPPEKIITIQTKLKKNNVDLTVSDQGPGIDTKDLPFIFDRFYRADSSRSKNYVDGYGIGLSIAKNIVEKHGGKITCTSSTGKGATFQISLPRVH